MNCVRAPKNFGDIALHYNSRSILLYVDHQHKGVGHPNDANNSPPRSCAHTPAADLTASILKNLITAPIVDLTFSHGIYAPLLHAYIATQHRIIVLQMPVPFDPSTYTIEGDLCSMEAPITKIAYNCYLSARMLAVAFARQQQHQQQQLQPAVKVYLYVPTTGLWVSVPAYTISYDRLLACLDQPTNQPHSVQTPLAIDLVKFASPQHINDPVLIAGISSQSVLVCNLNEETLLPVGFPEPLPQGKAYTIDIDETLSNLSVMFDDGPVKTMGIHLR